MTTENEMLLWWSRGGVFVGNDVEMMPSTRFFVGSTGSSQLLAYFVAVELVTGRA